MDLEDAMNVEDLKSDYNAAMEQIRSLQIRCQRLESDLNAAIKDRDEHAARYVEADARLCKVLNERCEQQPRAEKAEAYEPNWLTHSAQIDAIASAERSRDELGIQLAAQSERLRLAMAVVEAARALPPYRANMSDLAVVRGKIAALDAVPDALATRTVPRFVAGCDVFADAAHKARAVTSWAAKHDGPFWFVEDTSGDGEKAMCLVGGESMARRIAASLNGDAMAPSTTKVENGCGRFGCDNEDCQRCYHVDALATSTKKDGE